MANGKDNLVLKRNDLIVLSQDMRLWRVVERNEGQGYILANPDNAADIRFIPMGADLKSMGKAKSKLRG